MSVKPWPREPRTVDCFSGATYPPGEPLRDTPGTLSNVRTYENPWPSPPALCKHGEGSCEACGTTVRRDTLHTTEGGRGAVGRILKRK